MSSRLVEKLMLRLRTLAAALALSAGISAMSADASARQQPPAAVAYGFDGFWTGAQIGLASGYLATGRRYESHEWRKLADDGYRTPGLRHGSLAGVRQGRLGLA